MQKLTAPNMIVTGVKKKPSFVREMKIRSILVVI